jgi:hypothetical protein
MQLSAKPSSKKKNWSMGRSILYSMAIKMAKYTNMSLVNENKGNYLRFNKSALGKSLCILFHNANPSN